jgi:hypothetical protein
MDLIPLDERGQLFISPPIDDWQPIEENGITAVNLNAHGQNITALRAAREVDDPEVAYRDSGSKREVTCPNRAWGDLQWRACAGHCSKS